MVRNYTTAPVDPAIVDRALRNATRAPNAGFSQGWGFLVLDTPEDVHRYWAATADSVEHPDQWLTGMMRAPVVVVPCSSKAAYLGRYAEPDKASSRRTAGLSDEAPAWTDQDEARWPVPFWHMDAAMASLLILQTAVDAGLGGCFFGIPPAKVASVRAAFEIPTEFDPVGVITLGHPAEQPGATGSPRRRRRKDLTEVVHRGSWGGHAAPPAGHVHHAP